MKGKYDAESIEWMNRNPAPCVRCRDKKAACRAGCARYNLWNRKRESAGNKRGRDGKPD